MIIVLTSIVLAAFSIFIGYWIGRSNPGKSWLFTAGSLITLICIPFTYFLPKVEISLYSSAGAARFFPSSQFLLLQFLAVIWFAGIFLLSLRLILHSIAVLRWRRSARRCSSPKWTHRLHHCCSQLNMDTIPSLGISSSIQSPVVTGLIYPQILLPETSEKWPPETINHVLLHELGHIKRRDLWVSLASHIACAIHWFNPLVWILKKRQMAQCEFACDSFVLSSGADPKRYIEAICDVAETASSQPKLTLALAMADKASLRYRVELLLQEQGGSSTTVTVMLLVLGATSCFALNLVKPAETPLITPDPSLPIQREIDLRLNADPFPANH